MKRLIIGICVLSCLLILGISVSAVFHVAHNPTAQLLQEASESAQGGDWDTALQALHRAKSRWECYWQFTAAFADHSPMDEIDSLFAELEVRGKEKSRESFPALCVKLAALTQALADSHSFRWWTVL